MFEMCQDKAASVRFQIQIFEAPAYDTVQSDEWRTCKSGLRRIKRHLTLFPVTLSRFTDHATIGGVFSPTAP